MSDIELLDASRHADLRIEDGAYLASTWQGFVEIVPAEFAAAATRYPILFAKNAETGAFMAGILHGLQADASPGPPGAPDPEAYIPFALRRAGFFAVGEHLGIDLDHERLRRREGRPLFEQNGAPGTALREVQKAVSMLMHGRDATAGFIQALLDQQLVEPVAISLDFDDGERLDLRGLYTISLDRLDGLDDAAVLALFRPGYLQLAYTVAGSLRQLALLARQRNRLLSAGPRAFL